MDSTRLAILTWIALFLSPVYAADAVRGKELHDNYCVSCHRAIMAGDPEAIFTREPSHIASYEELHQQVSQCRNRLDVTWPDQNVDDVVEYLNQQFYKFPK